jgi:single-strand selective monofunctional uracil DNA glycosylase
MAKDPLDIARGLAAGLDRLRFPAPVTVVYNPLCYAWEPYARYVERWGRGEREVVLLGMNPGPFGMVQTGVPFGDPEMVRSWLGIEAPVALPRRQHPARPIKGFASQRTEVSGTRLWGWAREAFGSPQRFFSRFIVANYCPLAFMEKSGRNLTPDKLPAGVRARLLSLCDAALAELCLYYRPRHVIGIGAFAAARAEAALAGQGARVGQLLHPSPASPAANRGWARLATGALRAQGIAVP